MMKRLPLTKEARCIVEKKLPLELPWEELLPLRKSSCADVRPILRLINLVIDMRLPMLYPSPPLILDKSQSTVENVPPLRL